MLSTKNLTLLTAVIIGLLYWLLFPTSDDFINSFDKCEFLFCDFGRHYYHSGIAVLETGRPAGGFYYSPFFALLLAPISKLGFDNGRILWGIFQFASVLLLLIPTFSWLKTKWGKSALIYPLIFFTSFPVLHNIKWGQVGIFITALVFLSLFYHLKEKQRLSASLLGLAAAMCFLNSLSLNEGRSS